jgi:hypothetical protein
MNILKRILIICVSVIVILFTLAFTVGFLEGLFGSDTPPVENRPVLEDVTTPSVVSDVEMDAFEEGYMEGCIAEANYEFCVCTFNWFKRAYTREELFQMGQDALDGKNVPVDGALDACMDTYHLPNAL